MLACSSAEHDSNHSRIILQKEAAEHSLRTMTTVMWGVSCHYCLELMDCRLCPADLVRSAEADSAFFSFGMESSLGSIDYFSFAYFFIIFYLVDKSNGSLLS